MSKETKAPNRALSSVSVPSPLSPRALDRRIKRYLKGQPQEFFASCPPAFSFLLEQEVQRLGIIETTVLEGGVRFVAPLDAVYHANLQLRSAHRILLRIKEDFLAQSYPMLFDHAKRIPWELYLGFAKSVTISVTAKSSKLHYQQAFAETLHNAMLARLQPLGISPVLDANATTHIRARVHQDRCTLSLDTTGAHLHKRGYRQHVGDAPMRETLAAAVLQWLQAQGLELATLESIHDPFCGSGTFLIEADYLLRDYPVGVVRDFAFEHAPFFQESKWQRFKREALSADTSQHVVLLGSDIDTAVLEAAQHNSQLAGTTLDLQQGDALEYPYPTTNTQNRLIISNPPYGKRLGKQRVVEGVLESWLQRIPSGYNVALVLPEAMVAKLVPSHAKTLAFRNGNVRVKACYWQIS